MDDINQMISQVLSDPEKMRQIQDMAASLGLGGESAAAEPTAQQEPPPAAQPAPPDLSSLTGVLSGLTGGQSGGALPDLSGLSGILSGLTGGQGGATPSPPPSSGGAPGGFDVSSLASMLSAGSPAGDSPPSSPGGFDLGALMKVQQAMSNLQANKANIDLLLSLRSRLQPERAKKLDDAVRVMQILQFLPLLKESGLFGEMDSLLAGFGGGLGNVIGGIGGNLLPNLGRRR